MHVKSPNDVRREDDTFLMTYVIMRGCNNCRVCLIYLAALFDATNTYFFTGSYWKVYLEI